MKDHYHITIVGGGLIGTSLAIALSALPIKIALIDASGVTPNNHTQFDARSIALSLASINVFQALGLWNQLQPFCTAINGIHVTQQGCFGMLAWQANDDNLPYYGNVVSINDFLNVLNAKLASLSNVTVLQPAKVIALHDEPHAKKVTITQKNQQQTLTCDLLVAADGANSACRELLGLTHTTRSYQKNAVVANVAISRDHHNIAYERFTKNGPIALLPIAEKLMTLILTVNDEESNHVLTMPDEVFKKMLAKQFGSRLTPFTNIGKRQAYPLQLSYSSEQIAQRALLIGNAAHSLHPIAAQGFNLGLRDVATLTELLCQYYNHDCGHVELLQRYQTTRKRDQHSLIQATDFLAWAFLPELLPLTILRGGSLFALNLLPILKKRLAKWGMGLQSDSPKLALGVPLRDVITYYAN